MSLVLHTNSCLLARYVCVSVTSWTGCIHHATAVCPTVPPTAWSLATEGLHFFSSLRRLQATHTSFSLHKSSLHISCLISTAIQYMRGYKVTTTERLIVQTSTLYEARRVLYKHTHPLTHKKIGLCKGHVDIKFFQSWFCTVFKSIAKK